MAYARLTRRLPRGAAHPGYGHLYQPSESLYGWAAFSQAPDWSATQLATPAEHLDATNPEK